MGVERGGRPQEFFDQFDRSQAGGSGGGSPSHEVPLFNPPFEVDLPSGARTYEELQRIERESSRTYPLTMESYLLTIERRLADSNALVVKPGDIIEQVDRVDYGIFRTYLDAVEHAKHTDWPFYRERSAVAQELGNVAWAYRTITFPYFNADDQQYMIFEYQDMQRPSIRETGEPLHGIELNENQARYVGWLLRLSGIPSNIEAAPVCIPFAPMERYMTSLATTIGSPDAPDHEAHTGVGKLMQQWKDTNMHENS